jgi:hypothetical protein
MSKFRHLVNRVETLIGHGPVGPGEVIETDLKLEGSPNFEKVEDSEPVTEVTVSEDPVMVKDATEVTVKSSKKNAEPVNDSPAVADAQSEGAPGHVTPEVEA